VIFIKSKWFKLISWALYETYNDERAYSDDFTRQRFDPDWEPAYLGDRFEKEYPGVSTKRLKHQLAFAFPTPSKALNLLGKVLSRMKAYGLVSKEVVKDSVRENFRAPPLENDVWEGKECFWSLTDRGEEYYKFHQEEIGNYLEKKKRERRR